MLLITIFVCVGLPLTAEAQELVVLDWQHQAQSIVSALSYIAVDYPAAVQNGLVRDIDEYDEQREFAATVQTLLKALPPRRQQDTLLEQAGILAELIGSQADSRVISDHCRQLATSVIDAYGLNIAPKSAPNISTAAMLYAKQCSACHGMTGVGDGPAGAILDPPPTNFLDVERARQRSLYDLYATISLGVRDTGMLSFAHLAETERWALAFYVAGLRDEATTIAQGQRLWQQGAVKEALPSTLANFTSRSPGELGDARAEIAAVISYLRHHPDVFENAVSNPIADTRENLQDALLTYSNNQPELALQHALSAYLEGYELIESLLGTLDSDLADGIERDMHILRTLIRVRASLATVSDATAALQARLDVAAGLISKRGSSPETLFVSALLILLREGLEAILVVASMALYLRRTGQSLSLRYLHCGWIAALVVGALTWLGIKSVIDMSGAQREIIEGAAAMLAAFVLLYVGIWMHRKGSAALWQSFLKDRLGRSLSKGALWGVAGLSFIAVFREILETAIFYETLWLQSAHAGPLIAGAAIAGLGLVTFGWLVFRAGTRLPLRQFFQWNGVLMFALAFVFAGKGVSALQEAGWLTATFVDLPTIDWLGLYPTMQSLGLQFAILTIGAMWTLLTSRQRPGNNTAQLS